ncbi:MAG: radical SAM protein [Desulfobacterales bacterium]|nr:radical SAM protein [Desulfobacterales bacterium]MDD4073138.1 radical SAM protein [Desulfobacterales bacterium]MDD4393598.1 radical SAM protein [Desulfobacterales bacterium]
MKYPLTTLYPSYIEGIPLFHYRPGTRVLVVGTHGCNLDCKYCMSQHLLNEPAYYFDLSPKQIIKKAVTAGCRLISFTANEPAVSFDYFKDIAEAAADAGIAVGCSSNGLFSDAQLSELVQFLSFANISIKGPDKKFYQEICGGGSPERVFDCIRLLRENGIHVEATTPYLPRIAEAGMAHIARTLGSIDDSIPWLVFRLMPEYKLSETARPKVSDLVRFKIRLQEYLNHIYLLNFPATLWIDTCCRQCGHKLLTRMSKGFGAVLVDVALADGLCPECGASADIIGNAAVDTDQTVETPDPRTGYIEADGWKATVAMSSGCLAGNEDRRPGIESLQQRPYPGDMDMAADNWVTDTALSVLDMYHPDLMVMTYAQAALTGRHQCEEEQFKNIAVNLFAEIERFKKASGYEVMVVGMGDLVRTRGVINLEKHIEGVASAEEGIACLYHTGSDDADQVARLTGVREVISSHDLEKRIGVQWDIKESGRYFVIPEAGYRFLALSSASRYSYRTDGMHSNIPIWATLDIPDAITGIRQCIFNHVMSGKKIALMLLDGIGFKDFELKAASIANTVGGIPCACTPHQMAIISTGRPVFEPFFAYPRWRISRRVNPFSLSTSYLPDCLTRDITRAGKIAVSVGNKSILTHSMFPGDLSIECHCMALHNFGSLAVV